MDASISNPNFKKKKVVELQNHIGSKDKISGLPDSILHYILSFLSTKYVVGTSVLATRWRYLWTSVPNIDFDDRLFQYKDVMNFVDRVLYLLDLPNVHKFSLKCRSIHDPFRINTWISVVLQRKVQELILKVDLSSQYALPCSLFTCESLKILKIESDTVLNIPSYIHFPRLKVLHLFCIQFVCNQSSEQVSFTLPTLEQFVLQDCQWWLGIKTINIIAPKLKTWNITDYWNNEENRLCEMKVYAESLVSLNLTSSLSYELSLYNLSSLVKAFVHISNEEEISYRASKLLRGICNVKDLVLSAAAVAVLSHEDLSRSVNTLSSLSCLTVGEGKAFDNDTNLSVAQLLDLLCHLPNIQSFYFWNGFNPYLFESLGSVPQRRLSHLKSVTLHWFYGSKKELFLVEYFLRNAIALEKIIITSSSTLSNNPKKQMKITRGLLMLPKSSAIEFVNFPRVCCKNM